MKFAKVVRLKPSPFRDDTYNFGVELMNGGDKFLVYLPPVPHKSHARADMTELEAEGLAARYNDAYEIFDAENKGIF